MASSCPTLWVIGGPLRSRTCDRVHDNTPHDLLTSIHLSWAVA